MTSTPWLVLRFPRAAGATTLSGVLSADGQLFVERGETIAAVCDLLAARAPTARPVLVDPLDGRHGLAHLVLEEAQRRGWEFARHPPPGHELHVLDLAGADAEPARSIADATALLEQLAGAMGDAWKDQELGESIGIGRQALTLCLHHFGAWHPYTYWILSNLFQASAGTGNDDNVRAASAFVDDLLSRDMPETIVGGASSIVRLDELAHRCLASGNVRLATRVYDAAIAIARKAYGEQHTTYAQIQDRKAAALASS
ncbi:MAG: hypothetical protein IPL61_29185 [Myxococcales bacterium]|nr:hypothetical protein [Myxococcales bacterium]